jgi:hypothetical protein
MEQLKEYLSIFNITLDEFLTIAFEEKEKIVLITKRDMSRIKYEMKNNIDNWNIVRKNLPDKLGFIGFQHSHEGNVFTTYTTFN